MIRIGILGSIGSGKSHIAKKFGYPVFNADFEVSKLYKTDKITFNSLKKALPKYFNSFPVDKRDVSYAILDKKNNLNKIVKIIHIKIRKRMNIFLKKNKKKKIVVLDVPLLKMEDPIVVPITVSNSSFLNDIRILEGWYLASVVPLSFTISKISSPPVFVFFLLG